MLVEERRKRVLDLVSKRGFVALTDLARAIEVSESTIRRDLEYWHKEGVVRRTHGGAIYVGDGAALPALEERSASQLEQVLAAAPQIDTFLPYQHSFESGELILNNSVLCNSLVRPYADAIAQLANSDFPPPESSPTAFRFPRRACSPSCSWPPTRSRSRTIPQPWPA